MNNALDMLNQRRSVPAKQLEAPGPDAGTLRDLLQAAIRVPDHGKRTPWRLITLQGQARLDLGAGLLQSLLRGKPDLSESKREKEQLRYSHAPLVIAVIARIDEDDKIPAQEQLLSAGCVAYNLLLGAQALGFGAQWLTGWAAYDRDAAKLLGLEKHESVVGFIHIGTPKLEAPERDRPDLDDIVSAWTA